jgi:hypothetical protein
MNLKNLEIFRIPASLHLCISASLHLCISASLHLCIFVLEFCEIQAKILIQAAQTALNKIVFLGWMEGRMEGRKERRNTQKEVL